MKAVIIILTSTAVGIGTMIAIIVVATGYFVSDFVSDIANECTDRMNRLEQQKVDINSKLGQLPYDKIEFKTYINSDCLASSDVDYSINIQESFVSPIAAKNAIFDSLNKVGIQTPPLSQKPDYIFGDNGKTSGGSTPIKQIKTTYGPVRFYFELEQAIPCVVINENKVECGGKDKDDVLQELLESQPIDAIRISGYI